MYEYEKFALEIVCVQGQTCTHCMQGWAKVYHSGILKLHVTYPKLLQMTY